MTHVPVLIVGAGPVGLSLAGDLARRGIESMLVERTDGTITQPKMDLVGVRTMEFCRRWGIAERVMYSPYPIDYRQDYVYVTSLTGYELGREVFPAKQHEPLPPQSPQKRERCPQDMFDPILRAWVDELGHTALRYRTEFVDLVDRGDVVEVRLADTTTGRTETVTADYVVGTDGGGSTVRQVLGIDMSGSDVLTYTNNAIFRCPDLVDRHDKGEAYRFIFIGPEGTWSTIVAINGADRWRFSYVGDQEPRKMTEDEIRAAIVRAMGTEFDFEVLSIVPWIRRELVADSFGAGRVFIAGDAAHLMSPTGGFGMNTGIQDAVDLGWKLAAVLDGWGGPDLLDSYDVERRPVAVRNVEEASGNLGRMLSPRAVPLPPDLLDDGPEADAHRKVFGDEYAERMEREWFTVGIHLGYTYAPHSPIVVDDGTPVPEPQVSTYDQTSRPGSRAPHVWLDDGRSTLDLFGPGFVLLRLGRDAPATADVEAAFAQRSVPLAVEHLIEEPVVSAYERPLVLVRPDGHVAWRGHTPPDDPPAVVDQVIGQGRGEPEPADDGPSWADHLRSGAGTASAIVPFAEFVGIDLIDVGPGSVHRRVTAPPWLSQLVDRCPVAAMTVLADATLGNAVLTALPTDRIVVSTQLRIDVVGTGSSPATTLDCVARCDDVREQVGLATGRILGPDDEVLARVGLWAALVPRPTPAATTAPAAGGPAGEPDWRELPADAAVPVDGIDVREDGIVLSATPPLRLTNSLGSLHGGALGVYGELAAVAALEHSPGDGRPRPYALTVDYLRATSVDGPIELRASVVHRTRRYALVHVEVVDATGTLTAQVRAGYVLDRPDSAGQR